MAKTPASRPLVQPFVDEGLGNSAYLVGSDKVAALIDPLRDVDGYLDAADRLGMRIAYVLDTHLHNDFVSGSREVASRTGAVVGASAEAKLEYEHRPLKDGDRLPLGRVGLGVVATPGHTPEHISFTVSEREDAPPIGIFSGGALIVGGAARTDLLGSDRSEPLARKLYHSIHDRLLRFPDATAVFPTHGAGSFCAAPASDERTTTIGLERTRNPLCRPQTEDEFVREALEGLPSYPAYFGKLRPVNRRGPEILADLPEVKSLPPQEVRAWAQGGGAVLDIRPPLEFLAGHVPGAVGIVLNASTATWAGWLLPFRAPLVLVSRGEEDREEAVRQLLRIGFDDLRGYLGGGMDAWRAAHLPEERFPVITARELRSKLNGDRRPVVLDVRQEDEWLEGHIPGAVHIENGRLPWEDLPLPKDREIVVHCASRNRSSSGLSVLSRRGYRTLVLLDGGLTGWERAGYEVERGRGGP